MTVYLKNGAGDILFESTTAHNIKDALHQARIRGIILENLYICNADLSYAAIILENIKGVEFSNCKINTTYFESNDIVRNVTFKECDLNNSKFYRLKLSNVEFLKCNMNETDLSRCEFKNVKFHDCNLTKAAFSYVKMSKVLRNKLEQQNHLSILHNQPGKLYAYKVVQENLVTTYYGFKYQIGKSYDFTSEAELDSGILCGGGLNVATLNWCVGEARNMYNARIIKIEFEAKDIACIPIGSDGKFRLYRGKVVGEVTGWRKKFGVKG
jgi:hypothetical protein